MRGTWGQKAQTPYPMAGVLKLHETECAGAGLATASGILRLRMHEGGVGNKTM